MFYVYRVTESKQPNSLYAYSGKSPNSTCIEVKYAKRGALNPEGTSLTKLPLQNFFIFQLSIE